jgi:hypothetical protein
METQLKLFILSSCALLVAILVWNNIKMVTPSDDSKAAWIDVKRRNHFPPREYHSADPAFGLFFWMYFGDPSYNGTRYLGFEMNDENGDVQAAGMQFIDVNKVYDNPKFREVLLAIEVDDQIYEFPEVEQGYDFSSTFQPQYIGQSSEELFFAYKIRRQPEQTHSGSAILAVSLPLSEGRARIATQFDPLVWNETLEQLRQLGLDPEEGVNLCQNYFNGVYRLIFGRDCE